MVAAEPAEEAAQPAEGLQHADPCVRRERRPRDRRDRTHDQLCLARGEVPEELGDALLLDQHALGRGDAAAAREAVVQRHLGHRASLLVRGLVFAPLEGDDPVGFGEVDLDGLHARGRRRDEVVEAEAEGDHAAARSRPHPRAAHP